VLGVSVEIEMKLDRSEFKKVSLAYIFSNLALNQLG